MRSVIPILICCLYALSAVDATPFSKGGNAEVQQGNVKAAEPQQLWSEDKGDDDDHDDEDKGGHKGDECATGSVSILIGSSTFAIPCLGEGAVVDINGLLPTALSSPFPSPSPSSTVASSPVASSPVASSSTALCNNGYANCNSTCVDEQTDLNNCGTCANACSVPTNGQAICISGQCGIFCNSGYANCNSTCVDEQTDLNNCGTCANACSIPTNGQATCISGQCGISCDSGYTNCNGTCVNEQTDPNNCGTCANTCSIPTNGQATCISGQCGISCNSGYTNCSSTCVNEQTDPNNCGACGNTCNAYQHCDGACVCNDPGVSPPLCSTRTITFSDLPPGTFVPNCYQTFNWNNFLVASSQVYNYFGGSGTISRNTPFTVIGIDIITENFNFPGSITFTAYSNGVQVGQYIALSPGTVNFPQDTFSNIDSISVLPGDGLNNQYYNLRNLQVCG